MAKPKCIVIVVSLGVSGGNIPCGCPRHLAYKTVDSYIGKLRSIFHSLGRDGEWDKRLGLGNPAITLALKGAGLGGDNGSRGLDTSAYGTPLSPVN